MYNSEIYTADEEGPICCRCNHFGDDFDCSGNCGSENSWNGYIRIELNDDEEDCEM